MSHTAESAVCSPAQHAESDSRWHVLHTKSRQEKSLASTLARMEVRHYLPLIRRARYYKSRQVTVDMPLIPGYLFLWGTLEQVYSADRTNRVANVIRVVDQEQLEWELANIRLALARRAPLVQYPYLEQGQRVEIHSGPFKGLQGFVRDIKKADRLVLQVDAFGRAVSLEIDAALLEAIS